MKRYRFVSFKFDSTRSLLKHPADVTEDIRHQIVTELKVKYGGNDFDSKLERYLELETGNIRLITDYHELLDEVDDAYVCGYYYPTLTGACCLGEKIFNDLILRLRDYHRLSKHYKRIYRLERLQNWGLAIEILRDWGIITDDLTDIYERLRRVRTEAVHLKSATNFKAEALFALQQVMKITDSILGYREDILFMVPGELYIRKDKEEEPLVKEFFIPSSRLLGYKHSVSSSQLSGTAMILRYEDPCDY